MPTFGTFIIIKKINQPAAIPKPMAINTALKAYKTNCFPSSFMIYHSINFVIYLSKSNDILKLNPTIAYADTEYDNFELCDIA